MYSEIKDIAVDGLERELLPLDGGKIQSGGKKNKKQIRWTYLDLYLYRYIKL